MMSINGKPAPTSALLPPSAPQTQPMPTAGTPEASSGQPNFARLLQHNQPAAPAAKPAEVKKPEAAAQPEPKTEPRAHDESAPASPTAAHAAGAAREPVRGRDAAARSVQPPARSSKTAAPKDEPDAAATAAHKRADDAADPAADPALADWLAGLKLPDPSAPTLPATAVAAAAPAADDAATAVAGRGSRDPAHGLADDGAADLGANAGTDPATAAAGSAATAALGFGVAPPAMRGAPDAAKSGAERERDTGKGAHTATHDSIDSAPLLQSARPDARGGQAGSGDANDRGNNPSAWPPVASTALPTLTASGFAPAALPALALQTGQNAAQPMGVTLPMPVTSPEFPQSMGVQLSVLAQAGVEHAELHLNPPDMGPVSVQIEVVGNQARIDFGADVAATRQAIEAGLPELAGALRDAGLTLTGGGVSQHSRSRQGAGETPSGSRHAGSGRDGALLDGTPAPVRRLVRAGGVDMYA